MAEIEVIRTPSLGDNSHLLISGDEAVLVDPQRDAWRLLHGCADRGATVRYVLETHVHNDYVSGALEVAAATGARVAAPARGRYAFNHQQLAEGDELHVGDLTITAIETPGHTPEHLAYLVFDLDRGAPLAALTGGSLIVGSAGRTDLLGADHAEALARDQYRSLRRLAVLPDDTVVLPTHGAGSYCAASPAAGGPSSTIGAERRTNPALLAADEETFLRERLTGLPPYPAYYPHMAPINRAGPVILGSAPILPPLPPSTVDRLAADGTWIVDARDREAFAAGHLPGALNIELDDAFAGYVGWLVPFDAPLALVLPEPVGWSAEAAVTQLLRIGYEHVAGYLAGGVDRWRADGRPLRSYPLTDLAHLADLDGTARILDVRQRAEYDRGHIPGARNIFLGDLPARLPEIGRDRVVCAVCASGHRASIAASLLDRAGIPVTAVASGGVPDWLARPASRPATRSS